MSHRSLAALRSRGCWRYLMGALLFTMTVSGCSETGCGCEAQSEDTSGGSETSSDKTPPETVIDWTGRQTVLPQAVLTLPFSANEPDCTFECQLDQSVFVPCKSPYTTPALADGHHEILVRATDPAGNTDETPAKFLWSVDTVKPTVVFTETPRELMYQAEARFGFESIDEVTYLCRLDNAEAQRCTSPEIFANLSTGVHIFEVKATDVAGNTSDWISFAWEVAPLFGSSTQDIAVSVGPITATDTSDIDQDGDVDVVSVSPGENVIRWHENDGNEKNSRQSL